MNGDEVAVTAGASAMAAPRAAPYAIHDPPARPGGLFASSQSTAAMGLYVPATIFIRLINFGRVIALTWFMTQAQFGLMNILLTVINVLTPLSSLGLNEAVARYVPQHEARGNLNAFLLRALLLLTIPVAVFAAALAIVAPLLGTRFFGQMLVDPAIRRIVHAELGDLTRLSAGVIALLAFYFFLLAVLKGLRMIRALTLAELVHSLAFLALSLVALVSGHGSAKTMTACYGGSLALALLVCGWGLHRALGGWRAQAAPCDDSRLARRLVQFSLWAMIAGVTWQVLQYYPQWYLNKAVGNDAVAVFSAVRQIGQFVLLAAITLVTVAMTAITKTWETRGAAAADVQLSLAFRGAGAALLLTCAALALLRGAIIRVFHPAYAPGAEVLPLQLLFFVVGADFAFIALHFNLIEKPRLHFLPYAVGVAANILLGFWLVGPRLAQLRATAVWQAVAPRLAPLLSVGTSDAMCLGGAAWAGALAILAALVACLLILRAEGRRLDRGSYAVLAANLFLAGNDWIIAGGAAATLIVLLGTEWIFTAAERRQLYDYARGAARSLLRLGDPTVRHGAP